jgi:hypothetical protein
MRNESDDVLFTRHVTAHIKGNVDKDKISVSSPEVMARIEPIFEGYSYSFSTSLQELRGKIESFLHNHDPLNIVEKSNPGQLDEYLPEADLIVWLHLNQKLDLNTFWAVWEYQFADVNPFSDTQDPKVQQLFEEVEKSLKS